MQEDREVVTIQDLVGGNAIPLLLKEKHWNHDSSIYDSSIHDNNNRSGKIYNKPLKTAPQVQY